MKKISWLFVFFLFSCKADWSYSGRGSPQYWANISEKNKFCKIGFNQSPIDIKSTMNNDFILNDLRFDYKSAEIEKVKAKHYQKINFYGKNFAFRGKKKYWLKYIEFHHPSEHLLDSNPHSLEMQIYHKSEDEQWLAVSYFLEISNQNNDNENLYFKNLINFLKSNQIEDKFDLSKIIDEKSLSFFYEGSFTTPPCTEGVKWYIMKNPIYISKEQMNAIIKSTIFVKSNARGVQKFNPEKF
jgi:carbonic anhydrase